MPSLSGVLRRSSGAAALGAPSSLSAADEQASMEDALRGVSYIMEDDMETALKQLQKGNSAFHKVCRAYAVHAVDAAIPDDFAK